MLGNEVLRSIFDDPPAVMYETDWAVGHWVVAVAVLVASGVLLTFFVPLLARGKETYEGYREITDKRFYTFLGLGIVSLVLYSASLYHVYRHIPGKYQGPILISGAILIIAFVGVLAAISEFDLSERTPMIIVSIPPIAVAGITVFVAIGEIITRTAAGIPLSVGAFLTLVFVGLIVVVVGVFGDKR